MFDFKTTWKQASTWITTSAVAGFGIFLANPTAILNIWNNLPYEVKGLLPAASSVQIAFGLFLATLLAKFVKQKEVVDWVSAKWKAISAWVALMLKSTSGETTPKKAMGIGGTVCVLAISIFGLNALNAEEGFRLTAYQDSIGIWTICAGHTGKISISDLDTVVHKGLTVTKAQCMEITRQDITSTQAGLNKCVHVHLGQNQSDALIIFAINVGVPHTCTSSYVKAINDNDMPRAADAMLAWQNAGPKKGLLLERRKRERALFLAPDGSIGPDQTLRSLIQIAKAA